MTIQLPGMPFGIKEPIVFDTSHWEGRIRWALVSPKPSANVIKGTQGVDYIDPTAQDSWNDLQANGIKRGIYHYLDVRRPKRPRFATVDQFIDAQAENFITTCQVLGLDRLDKIFIDIEEHKGEVGASHVWRWCAKVENALGRLPGIYTRRDIWIETVCDWLGRAPAWTDSFPLWLAQGPDEPDKWSKPSLIPPGWKHWDLWQYAQDEVLVDGIAAAISASVPTPQYAASWGIVAEPPPVVAEPRVRGTVTAARGVRIRTMPSTLSPQTGGIASGKSVSGWSVQVISPSEEWIQLFPRGWVAAKYQNVRLIEYTILPL